MGSVNGEMPVERFTQCLSSELVGSGLYICQPVKPKRKQKSEIGSPAGHQDLPQRSWMKYVRCRVLLRRKVCERQCSCPSDEPIPYAQTFTLQEATANRTSQAPVLAKADERRTLLKNGKLPQQIEV